MTSYIGGYQFVGTAAGGSSGSSSTAFTTWNTGDQICVPAASAVSATTLTPTSGQPYLTGGAGMMVPAGVQVQGITFVANAAAASLTNHFAFLAIPDEAGLAQATVIAVSANAGSAAWATNAAKKFSFRAADGGSGFWTPSADTPVYGGIVQAGTTPATLRGITTSGQVNATLVPKWSASSAGGVTTPATLASVLALNDAPIMPYCRLSRTYS